MDENLFIVIGYIAFILYTVAIMGAGVLLERKSGINKTVCRKITHIISAFVWVICAFFFGCSIHWVVLNGIGALLLGVVTFSDKLRAFGKGDDGATPGLFYFGASTFVVALICYILGPRFYLYTGIAYYCLALGDGFAPIVAVVAGEKNVKLLPSKTLLGTVSVYLVAFLSVFVFSSVFGMNLDPIFMLSVAALTCITEFYGFLGLDNILIEFSVFGYLLLYHFGLVGLPLQVVLIASPFLAWLAIGAKAMTVDGGIAAFLLFALVGFFSEDFLPVLFIALLFAISTAVSVLGKRLGGGAEGHSARRASQIAAVGLFAIIFLGIYRYTDYELFYYLFFLALTEQFADSMASDIGRHTNRSNVNIITLKPIEKGISGGISALGTVSALLGSLLLMSIPYFLGAVSLAAYIVISLLSFLGTVIDSVVGALFQALYRCRECGVKVEKNTHCGIEAELIKGFRAVDNTAVNYIAGFLTSAIGVLLIFV